MGFRFIEVGTVGIKGGSDGFLLDSEGDLGLRVGDFCYFDLESFC